MSDGRRVMRVTLLVTVVDLSPEDRKDLAQGMAFGEDPDIVEAEMPTVADLDARDVADVLTAVSQDYVQDEMWGGTELFARFKQVQVAEAAWEQPA